MNIPIFNRISQINFRYRDLHDIPLSRDDVTRLRELERISVSKTYGELTASDVELAKDLVPLCRLTATKNEASAIEIEVNSNFAFACSNGPRHGGVPRANVVGDDKLQYQSIWSERNGPPYEVWAAPNPLPDRLTLERDDRRVHVVRIATTEVSQ